MEESFSDSERKRIELGKRREKGKQDLVEHQEREERFMAEKERKKRKRNRTITITFVSLIVLSSLIAYTWALPGKYDTFAKCLTEKGVVMYGEDWCKYTKAQKAMFGKSFKYINYVQKRDLKVRPTWIISGESYETVQSFQRLSDLTGCKI